MQSDYCADRFDIDEISVMDMAPEPSFKPTTRAFFLQQQVTAGSPASVGFVQIPNPSDSPSLMHTLEPSVSPAVLPSMMPSSHPNMLPTQHPTDLVLTTTPFVAPSITPNIFPSEIPSITPTQELTLIIRIYYFGVDDTCDITYEEVDQQGNVLLNFSGCEFRAKWNRLFLGGKCDYCK